MKRGYLFATLAVATPVLFCASAHAAAEKWVFVDGKLKGYVIVAQSGTNAVSPTDNPLSQASGFIAVGTFSDCKGPGHFHGTWAGKQDPAPDRCGFGRVAKAEGTGSGQTLLERVATALAIADVTSDRHRRSTLGCFRDDTIAGLTTGQQALDEAVSDAGTLSTGATIAARVLAGLTRCLTRLRVEYLKLNALVTAFYLSPPRDEAATDKFCDAYKKRLKRIRRKARCLTTFWVKAFLP